MVTNKKIDKIKKILKNLKEAEKYAKKIWRDFDIYDENAFNNTQGEFRSLLWTEKEKEKKQMAKLKYCRSRILKGRNGYGALEFYICGEKVNNKIIRCIDCQKKVK